MIKYIFCNGENITLTSSNKKNIFDVDSFSLIIGKNGSGKTKILEAIADKVSDTFNSSISNDCNIVFSNPLIDSLNNWGCVYYSPTPFRLDIGRRKRFQDASSHGKEHANVSAIMNNIELLSDFDIYPSIVASAKNTIFSVSKNLIERALDIVNKNDDERGENYFCKFHTFNEIVKLKTFSMRFEPLEGSESYSSEMQIDRLKYNLSKEVIEDLLMKFPPEKIVSYFIYVSNKKNTMFLKSRITPLNIFLDYFQLADRKDTLNVKTYDEIKALKKFIEGFVSEYDVLNNKDFEVPVDLFNKLNSREEFNARKYFSLKYKGMSSGQLSILQQICSITQGVKNLVNAGIKKILLLIDEGDAFLHLEWQRMYINQLNKFLHKIKTTEDIDYLQVVIATHSPLLATDIPKEYVCNLDKHNKENLAFASPIHLLLSQSFGSATIGQFASERINSAVDNLINGKQNDRDLVVIESIGSEIIKKEIERLIKRK